jgi:hypothetical protein
MFIIGVIYACYQILPNFVNDFACFFFCSTATGVQNVEKSKFSPTKQGQDVEIHVDVILS